MVEMIRGKRGCKVPVLLIKVVKKAMILLVDKREAAAINLRNPYLFATPSACSVSHLRPNGTAHMEWLVYKAVILKILRPSQALA